MQPAALYRVHMSTSTHINETDRAIHSFVCVAMRCYVPLCRPAVTDDSSAGFEPVTKNSHRRAGGLSAKGTRNFFSGLALITTEHPLSFYFVSPIVIAPTEIAVVDFDGLLRTETFLRAARHVVQHDLSTESGPFTDGCRTEQMLLLDCVRRIATKNFVRRD